MKVLRNNALVDLSPEEEAAFLAERAERTRVTPAMVKAETQRRILARVPYWKQNNLNARNDELSRIQSGLMIDANGDLLPARSLTAQERAEQVAIKTLWDWVKSVRTASDQIEALSPIPADFRDDARWPA